MANCVDGWRWSVRPIPGRCGQLNLDGSGNGGDRRGGVAPSRTHPDLCRLVDATVGGRCLEPGNLGRRPGAAAQVQVLVVAANIQTNTLKAEVEKNSM